MTPTTLPLTEMPAPQFVMSPEGHRIATYSWGEDAAPTVLCVHGFASSCQDNWVSTGWVRDLLRAGFRVLGVDQRGHGASDKPHDPHDYTMDAFVGDLEIVLDTYMLDSVMYAGYSLGGRVGWQFLVDRPDRVSRGILGGSRTAGRSRDSRSSRPARSSRRGRRSRTGSRRTTSRLPSACLATTCAFSWRWPRACGSETRTRIRSDRRSSRCCSRPGAKTRSWRPPASWRPPRRTANSW